MQRTKKLLPAAMAKIAAQLPEDGNDPFSRLGRFMRRTAYSVFGEDELQALLRAEYNRSQGFDPMDRRGVDVAGRLAEAVERNRTNPDVKPLGSPLSRTAIPLQELPERDLRAMGFVPSYVAVPERGQASLRTWRHPRTGVHVHQHSKDWLFHEDKWPSIAMLKQRYKLDNPHASDSEVMKGSLNKTITEGIPHVLFEGVPGYINYASGVALGTPTFDDQLQRTRAARAGNPDAAAVAETPRLNAGNIGRGALSSALVGALAGSIGGRGVGIGAGGATAGLLAGNQLAGALQRAMPQAPGLGHFAVAAGLPAALAFGGYQAGRALDRILPPNENDTDD